MNLSFLNNKVIIPESGKSKKLLSANFANNSKTISLKPELLADMISFKGAGVKNPISSIKQNKSSQPLSFQAYRLNVLTQDTLSFAGIKQYYDWNKGQDWWLEIEKALDSKAKDKPLILRPATTKPVISPATGKNSWQGVAVYNPGAFFDKLPGEDQAKFHVIYRVSDNCYPAQPSVSRWGMCTSKDGLKMDTRTELPLVSPNKGYEAYGMEDPRVTKIGDTYYIAYCAYSERGPRLALMSTKSFKDEYQVSDKAIQQLKEEGTIKNVKQQVKLESIKGQKFDGEGPLYEALEKLGMKEKLGAIKLASNVGFVRHGTIGPDFEDKDVVLFPKKINGKFALMHRLGNDIQIVYVDKLENLQHDGKVAQSPFWDKYMEEYEKDPAKVTVLKAEFGWEDKLGSGPPPFETKDGWLFIYHTSKMDEHSGKRVYTAGACLLDKNDPSKVLNRVPHPIFVPLNRYEKQLSNCPDKNVVFPTGIAEKDGELFVYSGAGDKFTEVYKAKTNELLDYIKQFDEKGIPLNIILQWKRSIQ